MASLQKVFEHIDQFAELWMKEFNIPGLAIVVTDREELLRVSTYGFTDLANQVPIVPDTMFEIGSLGKPFTSIALLQLRDEGKLDLHEPVTQYLPWFRVQSEYPPITVHHLMNHTAGIVRGTDLAPHGLYESWALRETKTTAPPGEYFSYSNIGYKTLGFLLERLTGQSLKEVIQSRVLDPLGMTQTRPIITTETRERAAIGYCGIYDDRPEHTSHKLVPAIWSEYGTGDGCEASTATDMAIYLRMLLNRGQGPRNRLISEESFDLMTLHGIWTGGDYYGYGLATYPGDGRTYIGHGGGNAGFRSAIVVDMEAGLGVVFLLNRMGETDPVVAAAQHILTVVRAGHRREEIPAPPPTTEPSSIQNAKDYAGTYHTSNRVLKLIAADGKLLLDYEGRVVPLERRAPDSFYAGHPDLNLFLLDFKREEGKVVEAFHGYHWYVNNLYTGPRRFDYPKEWEAYPGHYRTRSPELSNFRVVLRKGALALIIPWGNTEPLIPLGDSIFRIGEDSRSPETLRFDAVVEGRALRADYSGCPYYRTFTP
ncbi:serine hydrolase domain-containing protein [Chloroflexota bacterium]